MNISILRASIAALVLSTFVPASASTTAGANTFSGTVTGVSYSKISVTNLASHTTMRFGIVPTDGLGVVSADGKTTCQMSAIKVGWHVKIDYDKRGGRRHVDMMSLL